MSNAKSSVSNTLLWCVAIISLVTSSVSLTRSFLQDKSSVVSVDAVKLISRYKGLNDVKRTQQQRNQQLQANMDTLKMELQGSLEEYQKSKATSNKKQLAIMEEVIQGRQRNLMTYEQAVNDQIKKQDEELSSALLERVNEYVGRYGQKNGYTIILAATQFGNVAYANENVDITDQVLEGLNKEYKAPNR